MPLKIMYNVTWLGTALDNSGVFNGDNEGFGWSTHFKQNNSIGLVGTHPHNEATKLINIIKDNDIIDGTINDQDFALGSIGEFY